MTPFSVGGTMLTGTVFDIKGFALNDGPGIRTTVFMKGCPLRCRWCHNPEGLSPEPELYVKLSRCTHCGRCFHPCSHPECQPFGRCLHVCPMGNVSVSGRRWTVEELTRELLRDQDVFGENGGVTFSGGEPLLQHEFVKTVADRLDSMGISVDLETSSFAPAEIYRETLAPFSLVMADIKLMDRGKHIEYCGVPNDQILANLAWLKQSGKRFVFRVPLIPGITDTEENLRAISSFAEDAPVELLPYNVMAGAKYASVSREYGLPGDLLKQSREELKQYASLFRNATYRS